MENIEKFSLSDVFLPDKVVRAIIELSERYSANSLTVFKSIINNGILFIVEICDYVFFISRSGIRVLSVIKTELAAITEKCDFIKAIMSRAKKIIVVESNNVKTVIDFVEAFGSGD